MVGEANQKFQKDLNPTPVLDIPKIYSTMYIYIKILTTPRFFRESYANQRFLVQCFSAMR